MTSPCRNETGPSIGSYLAGPTGIHLKNSDRPLLEIVNVIVLMGSFREQNEDFKLCFTGRGKLNKVLEKFNRDGNLLIKGCLSRFVNF